MIVFLKYLCNDTLHCGKDARNKSSQQKGEGEYHIFLCSDFVLALCRRDKYTYPCTSRTDRRVDVET